jgi:hypothetical protein
MSNYLQNLIAKSFNQAEVARPRLASMFEPLAPSALLAFGDIHPPETLDVERAPADAPGTNTMQENRQDTESKKALQLPTMNQPSKEIETSVWRGNQQLKTLEEQTADPPIRPRQTTPQNRIDVQPSAPQASEKAHQENASPKPSLSNLTESKLQLAQQRNAEASPEAAWLPGRASLQQERKSPLKQSVQPHSKMSVPPLRQYESAQIRRPINESTAKPEAKASKIAGMTGVLEASKITVEPRIARPVETQRAPGKVKPFHQELLAQPTDKPATPTINVTIGRIEVRATTAAAQPRKQPPVAQTMSLDEYLRKRNQGGAE